MKLRKCKRCNIVYQGLFCPNCGKWRAVWKNKSFNNNGWDWSHLNDEIYTHNPLDGQKSWQVSGTVHIVHGLDGSGEFVKEYCNAYSYPKNELVSIWRKI